MGKLKYDYKKQKQMSDFDNCIHKYNSTYYKHHAQGGKLQN